MKNLFSNLTLCLTKFFTRTNLSKIIVIFSVGILSRYFINEYFSVNVFTEYLSLISITYYSLFATFVVFIHELFSFFNVNIIPNFIIIIFKSIGIILDFVLIKPFIYIYSLTFGKYTHIPHIKGTRSSRVEYDGYNVNNYANYPEGTGVSVYSTDVKMSWHPSDVKVSRYPTEETPRHLNYGVSVNQDLNSFYNRIAKENPYSRISGDTHPNQGYDNMTRGELQNYVYGQSVTYPTDQPGVNGYYSNNVDETRNNNYSNPRYFVVDSINDNGTDRDLVTPVNLRTTQPNIPRPIAPKIRNMDFTKVTPVDLARHPALVSEDSFNKASDSTLPATKVADRPASSDPGSKRAFENAREEVKRRYKERMTEKLYDVANPTLKHKEVEILNSPTRGRASVGFKYYNRKNVWSLYVKYHDIAKRKFFWNIWEKDRGNYNSYEEFKTNFDPNMNIFKEIARVTKSDISNEIKSIMESDSFKTKGYHKRVDIRDIKRLPNSSTQSRLNHIHTNRHRASSLPKGK